MPLLRPQKIVTVISLPLLRQKKCKDCRRGGGVDRWRRKGGREMDDEREEGRWRRVEGEIEGRDERWESGRGAERWGEKRGRCGTREREEGEMQDGGEGRGGLLMKERRGGDAEDGRRGREEAEIRE